MSRLGSASLGLTVFCVAIGLRGLVLYGGAVYGICLGIGISQGVTFAVGLFVDWHAIRARARFTRAREDEPTPRVSIGQPPPAPEPREAP